MKTIFCHPEVGRTIDLHALDTYLGLNYVPGSHTLAGGYRKLMPGHFLTWHDGEISSHRYWQPAQPDGHSSRALDDSTARLDQLLTTVRQRAPCCRRSSGSMAKRRHRFFDGPSLCKPALQLSASRRFRLPSTAVSSTRLPIFARWRRVTPPTIMNWTWARDRHTGLDRRTCLLFRRAKRRCGSGSGLASLANVGQEM